MATTSTTVRWQCTRHDDGEQSIAWCVRDRSDGEKSTKKVMLKSLRKKWWWKVYEKMNDGEKFTNRCVDRGR